MATAAGEGIAKQNYAEHENEGLQPGGTINSNQIHDLIFVMLWKNPNPESEIQKAMKLLANLNEDSFQITKKLQERQFEEREAYQQLCRLEYRKKLASLKRKLDKLTFGNNAYKENVIKTEEKINIHNLYFRMHHGTNTMAMEKKLLKEINTSQKKLQDHSDSGLSVVEEISDRKLRWNSLPSKNDIKQQIKLMGKASSEEDRKEYYLQLRARIEVKREIKAKKKDIDCLKRQLLYVLRKKEEAYKATLKLIKIQNGAILMTKLFLKIN